MLRFRTAAVACAAILGVVPTLARAAPGDLLQTFRNPTLSINDRFGRSVAAVGNKILVGASWDDTGAEDAGAAYLFDAATGDLLQTFRNPTPEDQDSFGHSVAFVGDNAIIGAPGKNFGNEGSGSGYLFDTSTGDLIHSFQNPAPAGVIGLSVAVLGDNVLVGGSDLFLFDAATGDVLQSFDVPSVVTAVAAIGDDVLVGVPRDSTVVGRAGAVYLFDVTTGEVVQKFQKPVPIYDDHLGFSIAAVGNNVLAGAYRDQHGAAYLFDSQTGELLQTLRQPEGGSIYEDFFGFSVAVFGDNALVGAPHDGYDGIVIARGIKSSLSSAKLVHPRGAVAGS